MQLAGRPGQPWQRKLRAGPDRRRWVAAPATGWPRRLSACLTLTFALAFVSSAGPDFELVELFLTSRPRLQGAAATSTELLPIIARCRRSLRRTRPGRGRDSWRVSLAVWSSSTRRAGLGPETGCGDAGELSPSAPQRLLGTPLRQQRHCPYVPTNWFMIFSELLSCLVAGSDCRSGSPLFDSAGSRPGFLRGPGSCLQPVSVAADCGEWLRGVRGCGSGADDEQVSVGQDGADDEQVSVGQDGAAIQGAVLGPAGRGRAGQELPGETEHPGHDGRAVRGVADAPDARVVLDQLPDLAGSCGHLAS